MQEPAGAVDADVPDVGRPGALLDPGPQLDAVLALDLLRLRPAVGERAEQVLPDLVPDPLGARSGEDTQLQPARPVGELDLLDVALRPGLQLDLDPGQGRDAQRAQVEPGPVVVRSIVDVVRSVLGSGRRGLEACLLYTSDAADE